MSYIEQLRSSRREAWDARNVTSSVRIAEHIFAQTKHHTDALWLARAYASEGSHKRAAALILRQQHLKTDPDALALAAECLVAAEMHNEALSALGIADTGSITFKELSCRALVVVGKVLTANNDFSRAKDAFVAALETDAGCIEAFELLISRKLLSRTEQSQMLENLKWDSITPAEQRFLREWYSTLVDPSRTRPGNDLVQVKRLFEANRFLECRSVCEKLLDVDQHNLQVYPEYVACLFEQRDSSKLFSIAHWLSKEAPKHSIAWFAIGVYYLCEGNALTARRYLSQATCIDAYFAPAWFAFAHTFASEGEHEQATTAYAIAAQLFPGTHCSHLYLGMQYLHLGNLDLAQEHLATAATIYRGDPLLLNEQGVVHYHLGEADEALRCFNESLEISKALDAAPASWACVLANMGFVYRRQGDYHRAIACFEESLALIPGDATVMTVLGLALLQNGDLAEAGTRLSQALAISRDDPYACELLERVVEIDAQTPLSVGLASISS